MLKSIPDMKDIKIIFTDIDWTIYDHSVKPSIFDMESINALKQAQKNGVLVYLCTARPYSSVLDTGLFDVFTPDGAVYTNGAVAFKGINDTIIHNHCYPSDLVRQIIKICHKHHLTIQLSDEKDRWLTKKANKYVNKYLEHFIETFPVVREKFHDEKISAVLLFAPEKYDEILKKELPSHLHYFRFDDHGVDIHDDPIHKSEGVRAVLEYLNISKDQAISFGDDFGDIEMFKETKYSVAVANGKEEVKQAATFVSKPIQEHGVAHALKHFKIID